MRARTPGVYVEEISKLPPSVAAVSTAIPAFVGFTEKSVAEPRRITSMLEYESVFGGAQPSEFLWSAQGRELKVTRTGPTFEFNLYYAISLYFRNGGGPCYVVSIGTYESTPTAGMFMKGLETLATEDEPTLVVMPEACGLDPADYGTVVQSALAHCSRLGDRFAILDATPDAGGGFAGFREMITTSPSYGAAYYPPLDTALAYAWKESGVKSQTTPTQTMDQVRGTSLYGQLQSLLARQRVTLPPSAAVAGVYASVDGQRGVWNAPANVALGSVIGPNKKITDDAQDGMNEDATSGKSINAIRAFTGKGTLVWGARTLDGSSNEWRYIPVRRLFIMMEESLKKATSFAVFEPNDAVTWLKVKAMTESFLYGLWQQGALAGSSPDQAYFVNVGLGKTMTPQDVLEGRMIVEIGAAAVRPAEFILLRFMHKVQEA